MLAPATLNLYLSDTAALLKDKETLVKADPSSHYTDPALRDKHILGETVRETYWSGKIRGCGKANVQPELIDDFNVIAGDDLRIEADGKAQLAKRVVVLIVVHHVDSRELDVLNMINGDRVEYVADEKTKRILLALTKNPSYKRRLHWKVSDRILPGGAPGQTCGCKHFDVALQRTLHLCCRGTARKIRCWIR